MKLRRAEAHDPGLETIDYRPPTIDHEPTMPDLATSNITSQLVAVLREAIEGPQHSWTYFTDNQPGTGLFGTIGPLSPADVSRPQGKSGTTIAGHVHHLAFCLHASAAWIRGERRRWNWDESWQVRTVGSNEWAELRNRLRQSYGELTQAIEQHALESEEAMGGAIGAVAHAAYHLAVIRQKAAG
jgi:hypothetical protein